MEPRALHGSRPRALAAGLREGLRSLAAFHGLVFFLAVAIVPHSHLNSLEDLLSDGPSDSGIFIVLTSAAAPVPGLWFRAARLVDDDSCLACFHNDFKSATEPFSGLLVAPVFAPLAQTVVFSSPVEPAPLAARRQSRAPPPTA
jgi:hypothetical protein